MYFYKMQEKFISLKYLAKRYNIFVVTINSNYTGDIAMTNCRKCGFENKDNSLFCASCDASLSVTTGSKYRPPEAIVYQTFGAVATPTPNYQKDKVFALIESLGKSKKFLCLCILSSVSLLLNVINLIFQMPDALNNVISDQALAMENTPNNTNLHTFSNFISF